MAEKETAVIFVGDGGERKHLQAAANGAANVRFLAFFPSSKTPSVLALPACIWSPRNAFAAAREYERSKELKKLVTIIEEAGINARG